MLIISEILEKDSFRSVIGLYLHSVVGMMSSQHDICLTKAWPFCFHARALHLPALSEAWSWLASTTSSSSFLLRRLGSVETPSKARIVHIRQDTAINSQSLPLIAAEDPSKQFRVQLKNDLTLSYPRTTVWLELMSIQIKRITQHGWQSSQ